MNCPFFDHTVLLCKNYFDILQIGMVFVLCPAHQNLLVMKNVILGFTAIMIVFSSCEEDEILEPKSCDCEYVSYDKDETTNDTWMESYRSSWDASCENELLDESVYTASDGGKWYSKTRIECK